MTLSQDLGELHICAADSRRGRRGSLLLSVASKTTAKKKKIPLRSNSWSKKIKAVVGRPRTC